MPLCKYCKQEVITNNNQEYECENCGKKLENNEIEYTKEESYNGLKLLHGPIIGGFLAGIVIYIIGPMVNPYFGLVGIVLIILSILMVISYFLLKRKIDNE